MRLERAKSDRRSENTIPLINVVFLMLVFFLIAGTIAPANDHEVSPVKSKIVDQIPPEEAISLRKDGTLFFQGEVLDVNAPFPKRLTDKDHLTIYPDQNASAQLFAKTIAELKTMTGKPISVLIERVAK